MVRVESQSFLKSIYSGAVYGAIAWTVYAVVECWFSSIQIWVVKSNSDSMPLYWGFTALLFGLYPVIGLMVGGLSGLGLHIAAGRFQFLQKMQSATRFRAVATLTIVLTFAVNLFVQKPIGISVLVLLFISFSLILGLVLSAGSGIWSRRLDFLFYSEDSRNTLDYKIHNGRVHTTGKVSYLLDTHCARCFRDQFLFESRNSCGNSELKNIVSKG